MFLNVYLVFLLACAIISIAMILIAAAYKRTVFVPRAEIMSRLEDPLLRQTMLKELERTLGTAVIFSTTHPDPDPDRQEPLRVCICHGDVLSKVRYMFLYSPDQPYPYPWVE